MLFDPSGNLSTAVSGSISNSFPGFDADNRPVSSSVVIGGQTYPSQRVVSTDYDIAMRPINNSGVQTGSTTNYVQQVGYWPHRRFGTGSMAITSGRWKLTVACRSNRDQLS